MVERIRLYFSQGREATSQRECRNKNYRSSPELTVKFFFRRPPGTTIPMDATPSVLTKM